MKSFCFFNFGWKFPPKTWKKQQWLFQSLLLKMSVSYRNRTYNRVLGGPRYIHLTKETNAVFPGFFDPLAPAAIIYNSNTFVMNYLFLISSDFSDFASLSDPQTLPFFFKRVPPWFYLRRRLLYPTELQRHICFTWNIYRIFILYFIIIHFPVFRNYFFFPPAPYTISVLPSHLLLSPSRPESDDFL